MLRKYTQTTSSLYEAVIPVDHPSCRILLPGLELSTGAAVAGWGIAMYKDLSS